MAVLDIEPKLGRWLDLPALRISWYLAVTAAIFLILVLISPNSPKTKTRIKTKIKISNSDHLDSSVFHYSSPDSPHRLYASFGPATLSSWSTFRKIEMRLEARLRGARL